jgi:prepilin signal peptidase PulO-like enzyme (type II secretory pathway)
VTVTLIGHALGYATPAGRYERRWQPGRYLYTAAELVALALVLSSFVVFGPSLEALSASIFCVALVVVSVTDLEYRVVPNRVVLPAAAIVLALNTIRQPKPEWLLAAFAVSLVLFVAALVNPQGMGMGDVKLAFLIGAGLGWTAVLALTVAVVAAFVPALVLLIAGGGRKSTLPFAPFLALGSVVALFAA